jgi:O-antigen ligase
LRAWNAAMQMAIDYPLGVGAGSFNSAFGRFYMPAHVEGYAPNRWISAHSVYFKVLGEYGIVGVLIVVFVIISAVRVNLISLWKIRADPGRYPISDMWPALLALGVVGYAVGAGFLGGINYPHLYFLTGLTMGCHRALLAAEPDPDLAAGAAVVPAAAAGPPLPGRRATATSMVRARPVTRGKRRFFE